MLLNFKLHDIDLFHYIHQSLTIFIGRLNDKWKNRIVLSFHSSINMCKCHKRLTKIDDKKPVNIV